MNKIKPVVRLCVICKKRRVIGHHYYCEKCWRRRNLRPLIKAKKRNPKKPMKGTKPKRKI